MTTSNKPDPTVIAALASNPDALAAYMDGFTTEAEPTTPTERAAATRAKAEVAGTIADLDPLEVGSGIKGLTFKVTPCFASGTPSKRGARVLPLVLNDQGKVSAAKSLNAPLIAAVVKNAKKLLEAIDTVEERALIGKHAVATEAADTE